MATVTSVTNHFVTAQEGFTTTTSGTVSSGAATVGLNSVAGYANGAVITLVIDPTDLTKKQAFTGTVDTSGVQITGVVWTEGTNTAHSAGATVVDYETATAWAMLNKGLSVEHSQSGVHKLTQLVDTNGNEFLKLAQTASAVNELTVTNAATGNAPILSATGGDTNIDINLTPKGTGRLKVGGVLLDTGAWVAYTPTFTNLTVGNGTLTAKWSQIGKTAKGRISLVFGSTTAVSGGATFTLPATAAAYAGGAGLTLIGSGLAYDTSAVRPYFLPVAMNSTTAAYIWTLPADSSFAYTFATASNAPFTWTTGDEISLSFEYEAA